MPTCPECGSGVEIGAIECPSCGVYPGVFPEDGRRPVIRASLPPPPSEEPSFSFARAAFQALVALFATLGLVWWAHGSIDVTLSFDSLVPEIALRLSHGFSIALPAVLLVGFLAVYGNRRYSWLGYGIRFLTIAALAAAVTLGPSYLKDRDELQVASQPSQESAVDPTQPPQPTELPSTGIPFLDAQLKNLHQATLKAQELQALREQQMHEEIQALEQPLAGNPKPTTPRPKRLDPDQLAQCMTDQGAVLYGTPWCGACKHQKSAFGTATQFLNYIDCDYEPKTCATERIRAYPTWEIAGRHYQGSRSLPELAKLSGCAPDDPGGYPEPSTTATHIVTKASYTWRDENGTLHVTSEPPPPNAQKIDVVE